MEQAWTEEPRTCFTEEREQARGCDSPASKPPSSRADDSPSTLGCLAWEGQEVRVDLRGGRVGASNSCVFTEEGNFSHIKLTGDDALECSGRRDADDTSQGLVTARHLSLEEEALERCDGRSSSPSISLRTGGSHDEGFEDVNEREQQEAEVTSTGEEDPSGNVSNEGGDALKCGRSACSSLSSLCSVEAGFRAGLGTGGRDGREEFEAGFAIASERLAAPAVDEASECRFSDLSSPSGELCSGTSDESFERVQNGEKEDTWEGLPSHIVALITQKLSEQELCTCRLVCHAWRDVANDEVRTLSPHSTEAVGIFPHLSRLRLTSAAHWLTAAELPPVWRCATLTGLDLSGCRHLAAGSLEGIDALERLESLSLQECVLLDDADVAQLGALTRLRTLNLRFLRHVTDDGMAALSALTRLSVLQLAWCKSIGDGSMRVVGRLPHLTELDLCYCFELSDSALWQLSGLSALSTLLLEGLDYAASSPAIAALSALPALRAVSFASCDLMTDARLVNVDLEVLLSKLVELDLRSCFEIGDDTVLRLASATGLTSLRFKHCWGVSDVGLAALSGLTQLRLLQLGKCSQVTDVGLHVIGANLTQLRALNLRGCYQVTAEGWSSLRPLRSLTYLNGSECDIDSGGVLALAALSNLRRLKLRECEDLRDDVLLQLIAVAPRQLPHLATLDLSMCCTLTDASISGLTALTSLKEVILHGCTNMTDDGVRTVVHFGRSGRPSSLSLSWCRHISDAGLLALAACTHLTGLDLSGLSHLTPVGLGRLADLTALRMLRLHGCVEVVDDVLEGLSALTGLTELDLQACGHITDVGVGHVSRLRLLRHLSVAFCAHVTDRGLAALAGLGQLSTLNVSDCSEVGDAGLRHIAALSRLVDLRLKNCAAITDAGLSHLVSLAHLTCLDLRGCRLLSDAGLLHLKPLARLNRLDLRGCYLVSAKGVDALRPIPYVR